MDCPLCPDGMVNNDRQQTAWELMRRYDVCLERYPNQPAVTHVCRVQAETGYALFAGITDILSFNPSTTATETTRNKRLSAQSVVTRLCEYGSKAAAPRPFICMADTTRTGSSAGEREDFATPYEFRARIFTTFGMGAVGAVMRHNDQGGRSESAAILNPTIAGVMAEIRAVRDLITIAAPLPGSVRVRGWEKLKPYLLWAGDKALVIFLVRQEEEATATDPETRVEIEVDIPAWTSVKRVLRVTPGELTPIPVESPSRFSVPLPEAGEILVLEF